MVERGGQRSENDEARMTNFMLILLLVLVLVIELQIRSQRSEVRSRKSFAHATKSEVSFPLVELQLGEKAKQSRAVPQFLIS
jgi:hypothetical protein